MEIAYKINNTDYKELDKNIMTTDGKCPIFGFPQACLIYKFKDRKVVHFDLQKFYEFCLFR